MCSSSSPPPAPDYTSAALATAQGNLEATRAATAANRINQNTPYGSLTYKQNQVYTTDKDGNQVLNPDAGWEQNVNLSPVGQQLLDAQNQSSLGLAGLQSGATGRVAQTMGQGMNTSNVPGITDQVGGTGGIQYKLNTNGVQGIPTVDENYRNQVQNALYGRQAQYLDPQWNQGRENFDAEMANKGLVAGGEAYNNAFTNFNNSKQQAYDNATMQAIAGGQDAMQGYFGMGLAANQQGMQNALSEGNFANSAQAQNYNQALSSAQLRNAAAQQQMEQNAYLYNQPLNTLNAIRTGSQVQNPSFTPVPQQQTTTGANLLGAAQSQYGDQLGAYNAQQANSGNFMSGLMGLGGTLGGAAIGKYW